MKIVKAILGTILGLIVFYLVQGLAAYLISLLNGVPIIGHILDAPKSCPWALTAIPPLLAVQCGASASGKVGKTNLPYGILLALYSGIPLVQMLVNHSFSWVTLVSNGLILIPALIVMGYKYDDPSKHRNDNAPFKE